MEGLSASYDDIHLPVCSWSGCQERMRYKHRWASWKLKVEFEDDHTKKFTAHLCPNHNECVNGNVNEFIKHVSSIRPIKSVFVKKWVKVQEC